jgi:hypothetical protein
MRSFTISLLLLLSFSLQAQLQKGGKYFNSTSTNFEGLSPSDYLTNSAELGGGSVYLSPLFNELTLLAAPEYGVFISDRLLLGGGLLGGYFSNFEDDAMLLGLIPFARYYFNPKASKTYFFSQVELDLLGSLFTGEFDYSLGGDVSLGLTHFLGEGVALDAFLALRDDDLTGGELPLRIFAGTSLGIYFQQGQWAGRKTAQAGFKAGSWMVGGSTSGFSWEPVENGEVTLSIRPNVYYFISDYLAVGAGVGFDFNRLKFGSVQKLTQVDVMLTPQIRFYLSETGDRNQWFIAGGGGIVIQENRFKSDLPPGFPSKESFRSYELGLGFGLNTFLAPNVALELGPNLRYFFEQESYRVGFDIGLQYFINRKEEE